jgi:type I restriction enzyme M protein
MAVVASSHITEREVAAALAARLAPLLQATPFKEITVEHKVDAFYPDLVLWEEAPHTAFAFWELKAPARSEDLSRLRHKALTLRNQISTRYVLTWNFQQATLYEITNTDIEERKTYPIPLLTSLQEWTIPSKQNAVIAVAQEIIKDLERLYRHESLSPYWPDKYYFIGILSKAIAQLTPILSKHISAKKRVPSIAEALNQWTVQQGYPLALSNLDTLLGRHWAYSLAVRLLFYFTIRRHFKDKLPDLREVPVLGPEMQRAFQEAQKIDWQAVFSESPLDKLGLPPEAEIPLATLLHDFHRYDFSQLKEDVIGQVMEGLIPPEERHALGQYFTREDVVDFILGFVAKSENGYYLDPTCGSGIFLTRLYDRLRWLSGYKLRHADLLDKIWGVDIAHFPAELATINLFRQDISDYSNFPRIVVQDFFKIAPGKEVAFPPLRSATPYYEKIALPFPDFAGIVGNFPYIRQEIIERQKAGYKKELVHAIARYWLWRDPDLFHITKTVANELDRIATLPEDQKNAYLHRAIQANHIDLRLSGQADIYAYLFYHAAAFLSENGRMGILTSNAWLDVAYGTELKRFFLRHFKIIAIVASWAEPWFVDAAINTVFVILERSEDPDERQNNYVKFVKLRKPLRQLLPQELTLEAHERWQKVDALVRQIEYAHLERQPTTPIAALDKPTLHIRLVQQSYLEEELKAKHEAAKWGLYLRAPQVFFDILEKAGPKLIPLHEVAEVRRGYTTGINDFFYLTPLGPGEAPGTLRVKNARGWQGEIEEACLRPVIKSPKEAKGIRIDPTHLRHRLFLPPLKIDPKDTAETLTAQLRDSYPLAYEYVKWGEQQRTPDGTSWPEVPSVKGRKVWWLVREPTFPVGIWPKAFNDRFFILENDSKVACSDRFYEIELKEGADAESFMAFLNSTLMALTLELRGRVNLGDGALDNMAYEAAEAMVLNPSVVDPKAMKNLARAYKKVKQRPIGIIKEELKQPDRRELDKAVLEALGLDPKVYLRPLYEGLVELVTERLRLSEMRATQPKAEKRLSDEKLIDKWKKEGWPQRIKPIDYFVASDGDSFQEVALTGRPVRYASRAPDLFSEATDAKGKAISRIVLIDAKENPVGDVATTWEAKYVLYAARPNLYLVKLPSQEAKVKEVVKRYEAHLRREGEELLRDIGEAVRDHKAAERLFRRLLEEAGLPKLAIDVALGGRS